MVTSRCSAEGGMVSRPEKRVDVNPLRKGGKAMTVCDLLILVVRYLPLVIRLVMFIAKRAKNKRRPNDKG